VYLSEIKPGSQTRTGLRQAWDERTIIYLLLFASFHLRSQGHSRTLHAKKPWKCEILGHKLLQLLLRQCCPTYLKLWRRLQSGLKYQTVAEPMR
jgi:hypothetical protein